MIRRDKVSGKNMVWVLFRNEDSAADILGLYNDRELVMEAAQQFLNTLNHYEVEYTERDCVVWSWAAIEPGWYKNYIIIEYHEVNQESYKSYSMKVKARDYLYRISWKRADNSIGRRIFKYLAGRVEKFMKPLMK